MSLTARPTPQLIIFDCDGVLVDSERLSHQVLQGLLAEWGVHIGFEEAVHHFIGLSIPGCIARVGELLGRPTPEHFLSEFGARTRRAFEAHLQPVAGVRELLPRLALPFCVASNGNHAKVNFTLGHTGLAPLFAGRIFTADDVAHPKPAPDLFLHAAARLGAEPARTVVVEDTPTGIRAARAAGMRAIGFAGLTPPQRLHDAGADPLFLSMAELSHWLHDAGALHP